MVIIFVNNASGYVRTSKDVGKHFTAVLADSTSGKLALLFYVAVKNVCNWLQLLNANVLKDANGVPYFLTRNEWYPRDICVHMTTNGSMEMETLSCFVDHFSHFIRKFILPRLHFVLVLDVHSSRDVFKWKE